MRTSHLPTTFDVQRRHDEQWRQVHATLRELAQTLGQLPRRFDTPSHTIAYARELTQLVNERLTETGQDHANES